MVIFSPPQPKYTVTVFTDVDCAYCRELHRQIADYNRLGVRVRYIFYPRTGPNTESWRKAEQVWCSADRKSALTRAKLGQPLEAKPCGSTPVEQEYELGKAIGLEGTPGIVAANGCHGRRLPVAAGAGRRAGTAARQRRNSGGPIRAECAQRSSSLSLSSLPSHSFASAGAGFFSVIAGHSLPARR